MLYTWKILVQHKAQTCDVDQESHGEHGREVDGDARHTPTEFPVSTFHTLAVVSEEAASENSLI